MKLDYASDNLPKKLDSSMQAPLITRWWSISVSASAFSNFYKVYVEGYQTCITTTKTTEKINVIVSNLLQMIIVLWIVADIHFLSAWFNKHFNKWYHGMDQNIGSHGYLASHRSVRCYIQLRDLIKDTWIENPAFEANRGTYNKLSTAMKKKKGLQR